MRKAGSVLAEALLCAMVSNVWSVARNEFHVRRRPSGQPYLTSPPEIPLPSVSLSHSRGWVACAASMTGPVGIDVEVPRPGRPIAEIARFAFGPGERRRVAEMGEAGFYRIWTLREALAKATGAGLPLVSDGIDRFETGPETGIWAGEIDGATWQVGHQIIPTGAAPLHLATARLSHDPNLAGAIELWRWDGFLGM
ncbi:4'-phosphopantetheinyl transferase superfamily protein [Dongia sp.]|uniref:4'-phosphopantetheinyl transferase family protein n=1 Tax=Dongia sp. TaxID=1977262 RepID=UPI0035B3FC05